MKLGIAMLLGLATLDWTAPLIASGDTARPWNEAVSVQLAGSQIQLVYVRSDWATDYDYMLRVQGQVYFNDCLAFINRSGIASTHIQFVFGAVDENGNLRRPSLPLDVRYVAKPGELHKERINCRDHAYANGAGGLWLVAWVKEVDFADGTSWHAPPIAHLTNEIREALPRE